MKKKALNDQHGIFQNFQSGVTEYNTRDSYLAQRGGKSSDPKKLYGVFPEHPESYKPEKVKPGSMSTRYVPGRPGVQALRVSAGVFQDPNTKEVFDYNEGFSTSDGRIFRGGTVDLQTDLAVLANRLDSLGLVKEASVLDGVLEKIAGTERDQCRELSEIILRGAPHNIPLTGMEAEGYLNDLASMLSENKDMCSKIMSFVNSTKEGGVGTTSIGEYPNETEYDPFSEDFNDDGEFEHTPEMSQAILDAVKSTMGNKNLL